VFAKQVAAAKGTKAEKTIRVTNRIAAPPKRELQVYRKQRATLKAALLSIRTAIVDLRFQISDAA
jgi:hypothetical protein